MARSWNMATAKRLVTTRKYFLRKPANLLHYEKSNTADSFTKPSYISIILTVTITKGQKRLINKNKFSYKSTLINEVIFTSKKRHPQMHTN